MNKQIRESTQISKNFLMTFIIGTLALFFFSCKKETPLVKPKIYTVIFDSKGGSEVSSVTVKPDGTITLPAPPTKAGFIFGGWYTDKEANTSSFSATTIITANLTLYAKWNAEPLHTVIFDSKGGSEVSSIKVKVGGVLTLPDPPAKAGFIFGGWHTDDNTFKNQFDPKNIITFDLTLYAKWEAEPLHTVIFDSKGGSEVRAITVKVGGVLTLPAPPAKAGFIFGGWHTDDNTFKNQFDSKTPIIANLTLYAKWEAEPLHTVIFDSKGGSEVKAVTVKVGGTLTLPAAPTKAGFIFGGWHTDDNTFKNQFDPKTPIIANLTLYAKWETEPLHTVIFDSKGGSEVRAITVKVGGTLTLPAAPTKAGFIFGGWHTDDNTFKNQFDHKTPIIANLTLYAKWEAEPLHTVIFDSKGGSEVRAITVKVGGTLTLPAAPTKAGFIFGGWHTDDNTFKNQFDHKTPIIANLTLYAKWNAEPLHTVIFDSKGGSEVSAVTVKVGGTLTLPAAPTKAGFIFGGWHTDDNTFKNKFDPKKPITANLTLYAKWETEPLHTVIFDSKGGSEVKAITVKVGGTLTLPAAPTKAGFIFGGWHTDDNTFKNQFDHKTPIIANLTLYAKWEAEPLHTVIFDSKGGSEVSAVTVTEGSSLTLPAAPTKAGFIFGGWHTDDNTFKNQFDPKTPIIANLTLYAKWNAEPLHTVIFDSKGGSEVSAVTVKVGGTLTLPAAPTKAGFIFGGWHTDDNTFKNKFDPKKPITANLTLYAKWKAEPLHTVIFDSKGGSEVKAITVKVGGVLTLPDPPAKAGFIFGGWHTDDNTFKNQFDPKTPITANLTLYAKWEAEPLHTVIFDSKGGSEVSAVTVNGGGTLTLPSAPTKAGFIFGGWHTDDNTFKNQFDPKTPITANLTLYAKWEAEPLHTVIFDSKGGSEVKAITVKMGGSLTLPDPPAKAGFIFGGWHTDDNTFKNQFDPKTPITANLTLYAKWEAEPLHTVIFDSKGGSEVRAITVKMGGVLTLPDPPAKAGFIFGGWHTDDNTFKNQFDPKTPITANLTLYAKWEAEPLHTVIFDSKGGSEVKAITVTEGGVLTLPDPPAKAGFIFGGWHTDDNTFKNQFDPKTPITANLTLYAKWEAEPLHTVIFDSKGGSEVRAITVTEGGTLTLPAAPSKAGFIFGGWHIDDNTFKNQFDPKTPITANLTLYAKWEAEPLHTVIFDSKGGSEVKAITVKVGGVLTLPDPPAKAGFIFGGWHTDDNTFKNQFDPKTPITANLTLYAKWEAEPLHTVIFDSKGGSEVSAVTVTEGGSLTLPSAPTKAGFIFGGWHTDDNTFKNQFDPKTPITANLTLYAKWEAEPLHTVIFDSKGGSEVGAVTVTEGGTLTLPSAPSKADFIFGGWHTDDNTFKNQFDPKTPITANLTLYAKWEAEPLHTVIFDSKGGSEVKAITVKVGGVLTLPDPPAKAGFIFGGWHTDDNTFKNQFDPKTPITANLTLYAKWEAEPLHTVIFDSKGGSEVSAVTVTEGGSLTLPAAPSKAGFIFGGWHTDDNTFKNQVDPKTPITANLTLYAKWEAEPLHTVIFDSKGGSEVKAITVKVGGVLTLPDPPAKAGFIFGGWHTDDNTFKNQVDPKTPITANLTLYAKWEAEPLHTVIFDSKGGSEVRAITVTEGGSLTLPAAPSKAGFIFGGWHTDDNTFKNQVDPKTPITANLTLYAKWEAEPLHTIIFDSKGGSEVSAVTVTEGGSLTLPAAPTKAGFIFGGWHTDDNTFKNQVDPKTPITANLTLYAKWEAEPLHTVVFDSKGGSEVSAVTVTEGGSLTLPAAPSKAGFIFGGWHTDDNTFKNQFDPKTPITANLTLYAKWEAVAPAAAFTLSSASFPNEGEIPAKYAFPGEEQVDRLNTSPQLSWANAPKETNSFLIVMEDLDFPGFQHWIVYNIPADKTSLKENDELLLAGPVNMNDGRYWGPWPPLGTKHVYQITIFALKVADNYFSTTNFPTSKEDAEIKLGSNILATAYIKGTFESK